MINATYVFSTYSGVKADVVSTISNSTTRVMTKILKNQKNLNITYSDIPLISAISFLKYGKGDGTDFDKFHEEFIKTIQDRIETEYVLLSLCHPWEIFTAVHLINVGKKVVIGGPVTKIFSIELLKDIFKINGAKKMENLIIVKPFINETIDLHKVIKEWKDIDDDVKFETENTYVDTTEDFMLDFIPTYKEHGILFKSLPIYLSTTCKWKKCTFCRYSTNFKVGTNFISDDNVEQVVDATVKIMKKYNTNILNIMNPELYFTETNKRFLNLIGKHNIRVTIFASIRLLNTKTYFENIKNYQHMIKTVIIGMETLDNFSLKLLNKGNTYQDTFEFVNKFIEFNKEMQTPIELLVCLMKNLAIKSEADVIENYKKIKELKDLLNNSRTRHAFTWSEFNNTPGIDYLTKNPYIKLRQHPLIINNKYDRIDENGEPLGTDEEIIDKDLYNELVPSIRW